MYPPASTMRLAMAAAVGSTTLAIPLQGPQEHPVSIQIQTGSITFQFHPPPLPPPPEPHLDARRGFGTIAIILILILFVLYLPHAVPRWLRDHLSLGEHVPRVVPPGRSSAVLQGRTASLAGQHTLAPDEAIASGGMPSLRGATLPVQSTSPNRRALSVVRIESDTLRDTGLPDETSSLLKNSYTPHAYDRRGREHAPTTEADIQNEQSNVGSIFPEPHQTSTGGSFSSEPIGTTLRDDETSPSTSHPSPRKRSSLNKSLDGALAAYVVSSIFVVAFGLDWAGTDMELPGVALDFEWLKNICSGSAPFIILSTVTDVTHKTIRSNILQIFNDAYLGTAIVLYFNGHGCGNSLLLRDGGSVDAVTLIGWITTIRKETGKRNPVYIVFEHCRFEASEQPSLNLGQDIHIFYACRPGERSADFEMSRKGGAYIPYSNFLKVYCLVLAEAQTRPIVSVDDFMSRMNVCMDVVVRMTRAAECRMRKCPTPCPLCSCPNLESCTHNITRVRHEDPRAYPRAQSVDGMFSGFEGGVIISELLEWIEPTKRLWDRIQETAETIKSHRRYRSINNVAKPPESNHFQPISSYVPRGRNTSAAQSV